MDNKKNHNTKILEILQRVTKYSWLLLFQLSIEYNQPSWNIRFEYQPLIINQIITEVLEEQLSQKENSNKKCIFK